MKNKTLKFYNTLTRKVEPFEPLDPECVKVYCCGPTVYDYQHIGNMRTYIFEDVLVRTLRLAGYKVRHVMNITDVGHLVSDADEGEDKMLVAMKREKKKSYEIAEYYTAVFFEDCKKLHIQKPDVVCKATDHINDMIELIKRIEKKGLTYISGGNVYFDVSKLKDYGKLARLDLEKLKAGARIEVDHNKRHPADFVLWFTKSKFENQELQWDSPWGRGYPGWHIECSAMSMKYLGDQFDIHCGGIDHIPVHHTNEIAQSEGATGKPWVKYWMHGEFLVLNKEKMSKSAGGFLTLKSLEEKGIDPLAYRYFCFSAHYRAQLNFSWEALNNAARSLERLKNAVIALKNDPDHSAEVTLSDTALSYREQFEEALCNDLNMPQAVSVIHSSISDSNLSPAEKWQLLLYFDRVAGFDFNSWQSESLDIPQELQDLLNQREAARREKDWELADTLRDKIAEAGYIIEDSPEGARLKRK
ncbi:MAG: cysteine--tRNA ligase [Candidatus Dadabacteria bacterium]|nr:MAG: cysteine--tRNA ligase [Candidatus Dadabacteria bacterium]